jgi:hypothetical protein
MGFGLVNGFIYHLYTHDSELQSITGTIAKLHNSQITTAPGKAFQPAISYTNNSLAMASNSGDSIVSCSGPLFTASHAECKYPHFDPCSSYLGMYHAEMSFPLL